MSLSNITPLPAIVPIRDPAWFEVTCNGYVIAPPEVAAYALGFVQSPSPGQSFSLLLNGNEVTFTFVNGPTDDSGTQVSISGNFNQLHDRLCDALRSNHLIDLAFDTTDHGNHVQLIARTPGSDQLLFENTIPVTMAFAQTTPGSDGVFAPNYTANIQVWVEQDWMSGVFTPLPPLQNVPDTQYNTRWDLRSFLRTIVAYDWPAFAQSMPTVQRRLQRRFYTTRWEQHGDPPLPQRVYRTSIRRAWFAGSRNSEHNVFQQVFGLLASPDVENPFLTYRGRTGRHEVSVGQQTYLGYYRRTIHDSGQPLQLRADVNWTDGTTSTTIAWTESAGPTIEQGEVVLFPTGFERLGLHALEPTKTPRTYAVQVLDHGGQPLSEPHMFHVVDTDANEQHIEYVNSLGVVESLRCVGTWSQGITTAHEEVNRLLTVMRTARPSEELSDRLHLLTGNELKLSVHTGFMDRGELNAVLDVLFSPEWRLVMPDRRTRAPLLLVDADHVFRRQGDAEENLHALQLEFRIGDPEMAWSDRLSMPKLPLVPDLPTE
jgi:hypothetical protein